MLVFRLRSQHQRQLNGDGRGLILICHGGNEANAGRYSDPDCGLIENALSIALGDEHLSQMTY
jgi:hypothetical protein